MTGLFLDLDRFKIVNDSLGHTVGDQLLKAVAERLQSCIREDDVCARIGGDEFAILLAGAADPAAVAERTIDVLQRSFEIDRYELFIGVSVGAAHLSHLPIDVLKVAKPFVDAVGGDRRNPAGLLAGVIALGKHLGLRTVAEGIEREDQPELLVQLGCDIGQGYLLGRPLDTVAAGAARRRTFPRRSRRLISSTRRLISSTRRRP